jgi:DNA polymerase III alpha subunit
MAFLEIEDPWGVFEVVVFPGPFSETRRDVWDTADTDRLVVVNGRVEREGRATRVVAERIELAAAAPAPVVVPIAGLAANRDAASQESPNIPRGRRGTDRQRSGGVRSSGRRAS